MEYVEEIIPHVRDVTASSTKQEDNQSMMCVEFVEVMTQPAVLKVWMSVVYVEAMDLRALGVMEYQERSLQHMTVAEYVEVTLLTCHC